MDKFEGNITEIYEDAFFIELYRTNKKLPISGIRYEAEVPIRFITKRQRDEFLEEGHIVTVWSKHSRIQKIIFKRGKPFTPKQISDAKKFADKLKKSFHWE